MTFKTGQSGNPAGRPKGIIDKRVRLRTLLEDHAEEIIAKLIDLAKAGDHQALRLCIERLLPKSKSEGLIFFDLAGGQVNDAETMCRVSMELTEAVASGQLTLEEADKFSRFISKQRSQQRNLSHNCK